MSSTLIGEDMKDTIARDINSKAVVSIDDKGLREYKRSKQILKHKNRKIESLEERIQKLEDIIGNLLNGNRKD